MAQRQDGGSGSSGGAFWSAVAFASLALIAALAGGVSAALTARFIAGAETGVARVVSSESSRFRDSTFHDTVFALTTPAGQELRANWRSVEYYAPNQTVPALYHARPPIRIRPLGREGLWGMTWFLLGASGFLAALAAIAYLRHRLGLRARRQRADRGGAAASDR